MFLRRSSMSSISEESEMDDNDQIDGSLVRNKEYTNGKQNQLSINLNVQNCFGALNTLKEEIREAYEELSTFERQARQKTSSTISIVNQGTMIYESRYRINYEIVLTELKYRASFQ
ncbi:unnamed protein product [Rotaria magnacalcarata]|uniref:Uncharacterized protein n=1 Tax=Rotaria magnacalcarata TaxID=392030 RepID=A0A820NTU6_9BILA|nr:unnamed protein product [Rotaria magnacalcarata]